MPVATSLVAARLKEFYQKKRRRGERENPPILFRKFTGTYQGRFPRQGRQAAGVSGKTVAHTAPGRPRPCVPAYLVERSCLDGCIAS